MYSLNWFIPLSVFFFKHLSTFSLSLLILFSMLSLPPRFMQILSKASNALRVSIALTSPIKPYTSCRPWLIKTGGQGQILEREGFHSALATSFELASPVERLIKSPPVLLLYFFWWKGAAENASSLCTVILLIYEGIWIGNWGQSCLGLFPGVSLSYWKSSRGQLDVLMLVGIKMYGRISRPRESMSERGRQTDYVQWQQREQKNPAIACLRSAKSPMEKSEGKILPSRCTPWWQSWLTR